jgi:putative MATE family efflux protein
LATLLRLAAPNLAEATARVAFIACDAVFVGWLGTDALAGVSLVFPLFLIMQMTSAGGLGTGVSAAVARMMGAGRRPVADALAAQGLMLGLGCAACIAGPMLAGGRSLYAALGASGGALDAAATYSALVFGVGGFAVWSMNTLANAVRGSGNMLVPALAIAGGEVVHLGLSPALILGWGPFPRLGVSGAALAIIACYACGAAILLAYLAIGRGSVRLAPAGLRPKAALTRDIMRVGGLAMLNVVQWQSASFIVTAAVAGFGAAALAGYGAASRLELVQFPLLFALGSATITMIATNRGAGEDTRARHIALAALGLSLAIGVVFAGIALTLPASWMHLFTSEPKVAAAGGTYLTTLGATYPALGIGIGLVFALQGWGRVVGAFLVGAVRLVVIVVGAGFGVRLGISSVGALYLIVAASSLIFAAGMAVAGIPLMRRRTRAL